MSPKFDCSGPIFAYISVYPCRGESCWKHWSFCCVAVSSWLIEQTGGYLLSSPGEMQSFSWSTERCVTLQSDSLLTRMVSMCMRDCVCVCMCDSVFGYYYHGTVIWPCWHGRNLSGSQSQLAPALMGLACVCMCVNVDAWRSCVRACVCVPNTALRRQWAAFWNMEPRDDRPIGRRQCAVICEGPCRERNDG